MTEERKVSSATTSDFEVDGIAYRHQIVTLVGDDRTLSIARPVEMSLNLVAGDAIEIDVAEDRTLTVRRGDQQVDAHIHPKARTERRRLGGSEDA